MIRYCPKNRKIKPIGVWRRRGRVGGRPEMHGEDKKEIAYKMVMENHQTVAEIAKAMSMSRATIYRYIEKRRGLRVG